MKRKGFTLIEVILVIVITGFLASVVIVNLRSQKTLDRSTDEVISWLRLAQSQAISGKNESSTGYGLFFKPTEPQDYFFYTDTNGNNKYDGSDTQKSLKIYSPTELETCSYKAGLKCDVFFSLPDGAVYTNGTLATENPTLTLQSSAEGSRIITINIVSGLISL